MGGGIGGSDTCASQGSRAPCPGRNTRTWVVLLFVVQAGVLGVVVEGRPNCARPVVFATDARMQGLASSRFRSEPIATSPGV